MVLASILPKCESSEMPLKLVVAIRPATPLVQYLDGGVLPLLRRLSPVPHFYEDGTEMLPDNGLIVAVGLEQFAPKKVGVQLSFFGCLPQTHEYKRVQSSVIIQGPFRDI